LSYLNSFQKVLGMAKASTVTAIKGASDRMAAKADFLLQGCESHAEAGESKSRDRSRVMLPNEFLRACKLTNLNIPKLVSEMQEGHLVFKVAGHADTLAKRARVSATMMENVSAAQQQNQHSHAAQVIHHSPSLSHPRTA
jgi:hypothetical protein